MSSTTVRDAVDGGSITFIGPDHEKIARLHWEVAARHWITIREVYRMVRVAVFGPAALDDEFDPIKELKQLRREAVQDRSLLKLQLPINELLLIWERSRDLLRLEAALDPEKRTRIEGFLAEREAAMEPLRDKAKALLARRAIGGGR